MAAQTLNLTGPRRLEIGASTDFTLTVKDSSGALRDFTDFTALLEIKAAKGDAENVLAVSTTPTANASVITLGGAAGTVQVFIDNADTATLSTYPSDDGTREYAVYDLRLTSGAANPVVEYVVEGQVEIKEMVTD